VFHKNCDYVSGGKQETKHRGLRVYGLERKALASSSPDYLVVGFFA
jgi:hypothetical protein